MIVINIDSTMAAQDHWCFGDTTFDGAYDPEHSFRIMDIKLLGNNLNTGDTCGINVWAVNEDDTSSEAIIAPSDCLHPDALVRNSFVFHQYFPLAPLALFYFTPSTSQLSSDQEYPKVDFLIRECPSINEIWTHVSFQSRNH